MASILFLTTHLPFPPASGGRRREYELIRRASRKHDVHLCVMSISYSSDVDNMPYMLRFCKTVNIFRLNDPQEVRRKYGPGCPDHVIYHTSFEAKKYIESLLQSKAIDAVHVERFYLMQHLPEDPPAPVLLVEQNIEYEIWRQKIALASHKDRRNHHQYELTKMFEVEMWRSSSLCGVLTNDDRLEMANFITDAKIELVPDGSDHSSSLDIERSGIKQASLPSKGDSPTILFVGNFDYEPSQEAAFFLAQEIFPRIQDEISDLELFLVGQDLGHYLAPLGKIPHIHITGTVDSLEPYFQLADVFVCPLRIGGGIKVKMLEALQHHMPIVSTSVGAQGLPAIPRSPIIVEDDVNKFCEQIVCFLRDPVLAKELGGNAREVLNLLPTWEDAAQRLDHCYSRLLSLK